MHGNYVVGLLTLLPCSFSRREAKQTEGLKALMNIIATPSSVVVVVVSAAFMHINKPFLRLARRAPTRRPLSEPRVVRDGCLPRLCFVRRGAGKASSVTRGARPPATPPLGCVRARRAPLRAHLSSASKWESEGLRGGKDGFGLSFGALPSNVNGGRTLKRRPRHWAQNRLPRPSSWRRCFCCCFLARWLARHRRHRGRHRRRRPEG